MSAVRIKKKRKERLKADQAPNSIRAKRWFLYGIHGLKIQEDHDGFSSPMFGDATLVGTEFLLDTLASNSPANLKYAAAVSGVGELVEVLDRSAIPHGDKIVEQRPDSFVAVCRTVAEGGRPDYLAIESRAEEIVALLAIAHAANTRCAETFAGSELAKPQAPVSVVARAQFAPSGEFVTAEQTVLKAARLVDALTPSKAELRESWANGTKLAAHASKKWSIPKNESLLEILSRSRRTPVEREIVAAALNLYRSYHAVTPGQRLAGAVATLELLFTGQSDFKKLEARLATFGIAGIKELLAARHVFVHKGGFVSPGAAAGGLGVAGLALWAAAFTAPKLGSLIHFWHRLDLLVAAQALDGLWSEKEAEEFRDRYALMRDAHLPPSLREEFGRVRVDNRA